MARTRRPDPSLADDPSTVPATPPELLDVAGFGPTDPRTWVEGFLRDTMGDVPNAAHATAQFLGVYDRRPRLAALARGSRRDQEAFVLVVATLVEELGHVTRTRFEHVTRDAGGMLHTHAVAVNAELDHLLGELRKRGKLPAPLAAHIERHLLALKVPVPSGRSGPKAIPVNSLIHALAFALGHVDGLSDVDRWRLIAHVVEDWMGGKKTPTQVRRLAYKRTYSRTVRGASACAMSLVPAIAVATPVAALLTACGRLAPIAPHGACGPPVPGLSVGAIHANAPTVEEARAELAGKARLLFDKGLALLAVRTDHKPRRI